MSLVDINNIISRLLALAKNFELTVISAYKAGSINLKPLLEKMGFSFYSSSDIDIHIVVKVMRSKGYILKKNRYGVFLVVDDFPKFIRHKNLLVDTFLMPSDVFCDVELLLRSHLQLAASTHLYYSEILYDTNGFLARIKREIMEKFPKKEYVKARLDFVYNLAHQKIREYLEEPAHRRKTLKSIWDGPIWALMSAGNLIITQQLLPPTFRRHLVMVRFLLERLNMRHLYDELLEVWGFKNLSRKDVEEYYQKMKEAYNTLIKLGIEDYIIHRYMKTYWFDGIKKLLELDYFKEASFPILRVFSRIAYILQKRDIHSKYQNILNPAYDMLFQMGFNLDNNCMEKINEIMHILESFYTETKKFLYNYKTNIRVSQNFSQ